MSDSSSNGSYFLALLLIIGMSGIGATAYADTDLKFGNAIKELKVSGDFRLRYDDKIFRGDSKAGKPDTPVFRERLRLALDLTLPSNFYVHTRFASGTSEQTSTNQTFGNEATQKQFWIDRAYVEWVANPMIKLYGGKMANPLWTQYSSDAWVDADINPEGAGQNFNYLLGDTNIFLNALQSPISQTTTPHDVYLFSEQIGVETKLPMDSRLKLGFAYHDWYNINRSTVTQLDKVATYPSAPNPKQQEGNRRDSNGAIIDPFYVTELTAELSGWVGKIPLSLQGTFLENHGAKEIADAAGLNKEKQNKGYQMGAILGKAKDANTWEVAYFNKYLQTDSTIANWADSDFGDGGTNRKGHIVWVAYAPVDWLLFQAKYFQTKPIDRHAGASATTGNGSINRVQLDTVVKF